MIIMLKNSNYFSISFLIALLSVFLKTYLYLYLDMKFVSNILDLLSIVSSYNDDVILS